MSMVDTLLVIPFITCFYVAQCVVHSTIVMVWFKQKNRTCKSDPYFIGKVAIGSHLKVGIA